MALEQHLAHFNFQRSELSQNYDMKMQSQEEDSNTRTGQAHAVEMLCCDHAVEMLCCAPFAAVPGECRHPAELISCRMAFCAGPQTHRVSQTVPDTSLGDWIQPQHSGCFLSLLSGLTSSPSPTEPLNNMHYGKKRPSQSWSLLRQPM